VIKRACFLLCLSLVMFVAGFYVAKLRPTNVYAQGRAPTYSVPKAYGTLRAAVGGWLFFEDNNGTVRLVGVNLRDLPNTVEGPPTVLCTLDRR
jgi:hypothetical protein